MDEDQLYVLLRLRLEDKAADKAREAGEAASEDAFEEARGTDANGVEEEGVDDTPFDDEVPGERMMVYDSNNPCLAVATVYPNMKEKKGTVEYNKVWEGC
ncbi:hypothetical protein E2562_038888 [Oryza meyeriana var. granulata]|uniref:Uncharacterized protein n=1 Tax=Oryza meyeriana var. granulata TaxID=110450 RepID=A0A6G1EUE8_9ORYZ|nr:hypothetical protein E2562_038888 [Oryza meyeriana var. granulata]